MTFPLSLKLLCASLGGLSRLPSPLGGPPPPAYITQSLVVGLERG